MIHQFLIIVHLVIYASISDRSLEMLHILYSKLYITPDDTESLHENNVYTGIVC